MCSITEVGAPPEIEPGDLVEELDSVLAKSTRVEARATALLGKVISAEAYRRDGYSSPTAMLKHRFSMTSGDAHQMVVRAKNLGEAPLVELAYVRGAITSAQTDALIYAKQVAPEPFESAEADLVEVALDTPSVHNLRKKLNYWLECVAEDELASDRMLSRELRSLRIRRDGEMVRVSGWFDPEAGEQVIAAIEPGPSIPGDGRPAHVRRADTFMDLINGATERPNVTVHVSLDKLPNEPISETSTGVFLNSEDTRRLACDSTVSRVVFGSDSAPIDVGRAKRVVTPSMRIALEARDKGCVFPGCDRPPHWADAHHLIHWADGGPTDLENLVLLCRYHHTLIHDHKWYISGKPGALRFYRPNGTEWTGKPIGRIENTALIEVPKRRIELTGEFLKEFCAEKSQWERPPPG